MLRGSSHHPRRSAVGQRLFKGILFGASLLAVGLALPTGGAQAQFVCAGNTPATAGGDGATAGAAGDFACGTNAAAIGGASTATGFNAIATGSASTATGNNAIAIGVSSTATGTAAGAFGDYSTATGVSTVAIGDYSTATGAFAQAIGPGSTATGSNATATGIRSTATGFFATASAENSTATGFNASATFKNSSAFGANATTTRPDQQVFGTASNTYTMPGITSAASQAAQTGALQFVTSDVGGNLAARTAASFGLATTSDVAGLQSQINGLGRRDKELAGGIAIATAIATPTLLSGQTFAMRGGWGSFDGETALSFSAAGLLARGYAGSTSSLVVDVGVGSVVDVGSKGTGTNMTAGRAGITFGW